MQNLENRAREIEDWVEQCFVDGHGVIYSAINKATEKPLDRHFFTMFPDESPHVRNVPPEDFWRYENCGMTTGAYLQAMAFRYRVEKDPAALTRARRCFEALSYIYEIGKAYEEGFFPKIYGGHFSMQTSSDQVLYAAMALDQYFDLADAAAKLKISRMITEMARFWMRHEYKFGYYNRPEIQWPLVRFPSLLLLAYNHSRDDAFKTEYDRLVNSGVTDAPEFSFLHFKKTGQWDTTPREQKIGAWLIKAPPDAFAMDVMQFDYQLRHDPKNTKAPKWTDGMALMWNESKIVIAPDGKAFYNILVDMQDGAVRNQKTPDYSKEMPDYIPGLKWGRGTITARTVVQARAFFPQSREMVEAAMHILTSFQRRDMVCIDDTHVTDPQKIPANLKPRAHFYCGDTVSNWLWAYWQGRHAGYWSHQTP